MSKETYSAHALWAAAVDSLAICRLLIPRYCIFLSILCFEFLLLLVLACFAPRCVTLVCRLLIPEVVDIYIYIYIYIYI